MDDLVALFRSCTECLKSILTTQQFGSEYELLCSELSVQWLRIRLWGELVGLHIEDAHHLQNSLFSRPEVESTITQSVNCIAYILKEIEVVRRKYELRPRLELITDSSSRHIKSSISEPMAGLPDLATRVLQQRMRDNQKQKSFLAITKWALCDSRRFDEKVKKLKIMIDSLEDISVAAGITRPTAIPQPETRESSLPEEDSPPPYSFEAPSNRRPSQASQASIVEPVVNATAAAHSSFQGSALLEPYIVLRTFLGPDFVDAGHPGSRAQDKLSKLSYKQFKELSTDVYEELLRRQEIDPTFAFLPPNAIYADKRNQARKKLSTLPGIRYTDLVMDVVLELDRRYPHLQEDMPKGIDPFSVPRSPTTRRYGCVLPPNTPPPSLNQRPMYRTMSSQSLTVSRSPPTSSPSLSQLYPMDSPTSSTLSSPSSPRTVEIFKTLRVCHDDPTWKVLPIALKKYNMNAPAENYDLWITYGEPGASVEKCLGADEKPLALFKQLDKLGRKPVFMMRKKAENVAFPPGGIL